MSGESTYREYQYVCVWPTEHTAAVGECGCQGESGLEIPLLPVTGGLPAMQLVNETIYTSNARFKKLYTDHDFAFGWDWVPSFPYVAGICGGDIKVALPPCRVLHFSYQSDVCVDVGDPHYTLVHRQNTFTLVDNEGRYWFFHGIAAGTAHPGRLISGPAAHGGSGRIEPFDPDDPGGDPYTPQHHLKGLRFVETVDDMRVTYAYVLAYETGSDGWERTLSATMRLCRLLQGSSK